MHEIDRFFSTFAYKVDIWFRMFNFHFDIAGILSTGAQKLDEDKK